MVRVIATHSRKFRFALLFGLAMTEMMPVALIAQAMPILMRRSGASLQAIGALSLVLLPRALKVLWAPLVDKIGAHSRFGRYRGWLLGLHTLLIVTLALGAFADIPALLTTRLTVGIAAMFWLSMLSATADTASHGLAVNLLEPEERGVGNGLQSAGMMLGSLVGGGLLVILVDEIGWKAALLIMAGCIVLPLPGVLLYQEQAVDARKHISLGEFFSFFKQSRINRWLLLLAVMALGPTTIDVVLPTLLVDRGYALAEIGLVMGVITSISGAAGGAFGGVVVKRLGRERAFYALTFLCALCLASTLLTRMAAGRALLYAGLTLPYFGVVARATLIYAMVMDRSRGHVASSDYTLQVTVVQVSGFLGLGIGGIVAEQLGTITVFVLAPLLTLVALLAAKRLLVSRDFDVSPEQDLAPPRS